MKTRKYSVSSIQSLILCGLCALCGSIPVRAFDTNVFTLPVVPDVGTNAIPSQKDRVIALAQGISTSKEIIAAIYPSYAPALKVNGKSKSLGFGIAVLYPLAKITDQAVLEHTFTGLRLDELGGNLYTPSVNMGLRGDMQLWGHNFTGLAYTGVVIPISGAGANNGSMGAIAGAGANTVLLKFGKADPTTGVKPGNLDVFATAEKWTQFDGMVYHIGAALKWSF